jgi:hypothetical protein
MHLVSLSAAVILLTLLLFINPRHGYVRQTAAAPLQYQVERENADGTKVSLEPTAYPTTFSGKLRVPHTGDYFFTLACPVYARVTLDRGGATTFDSYTTYAQPSIALDCGLHSLIVEVMNRSPSETTDFTIYMSKDVPVQRPLPADAIFRPGVGDWQFTLCGWILFGLACIVLPYMVFALRRLFPKRLRDLHFWLIWFGAATLFVLAFLEIGLWLFKFKPKRFVPVTVSRDYRLHAPHARNNYYGSPLKVQEFVTSVNCNSQGWRDREYMESKTPGTFRFCVLGDSYVEAKEVELDQTFHKRLESGLNQAAGPAARRFEVIALGWGGKSTQDEILFLREHGLKYAPDAVILAFFSANDIAENSPELTRRYIRWLAEVYFSKIVAARVACYDNLLWLPWSYLNRLVAERCSEYYSAHLYLFDRAVKREDMMSPQNEVYTEAAQRSPWLEAWDTTKADIKELRDLCGRNGAQLYMMIIDSYHIPELAAGRLNLNQPYREIVDFCEQNDISYLNLQEALEPYAHREERLHYRYDGHWNPRGHELAAQALQSFLVGQERMKAFVADGAK